MLAMNPPETVSFSDTTLLRMLSSRKHRPNLLIENKRASLDGVLQQLSEVCEGPMSVCRLPGRARPVRGARRHTRSGAHRPHDDRAAAHAVRLARPEGGRCSGRFDHAGADGGADCGRALSGGTVFPSQHRRDPAVNLGDYCAPRGSARADRRALHPQRGSRAVTRRAPRGDRTHRRQRRERVFERGDGNTVFRGGRRLSQRDPLRRTADRSGR